MNDPLFTIVIPTYNRAGFIAITIDSILKQTFTNFEVIVIDDGSTDNTESVVRAIADARVQYVKKENGERGAARNAGARRAKGKYVNFVDSDDVLYSNHTEEAYKVITKDPSIKAFHLGYDVKDAHGKFLRDSSDVHDINKQILIGNVLSCNGVFIEKETALENPFSENRVLSAIEDWELWIRLASKCKFVHVPVITSTVVNHDERSVMSVDISKIKSKTGLFIDMVSTNADLRRSFGTKVNRIIASALTYTALHIAIAKGDRSEISSFTLRGIRKNPGEMLRKRFLVILKLLVLR
jgi:glycosyltransferase involved in cell wall biosynthesis